MSRIWDYQESKKPYRNDVITFRVITPLKRNAPLQKNNFYHAKLLTLNLRIRICYLELSTMTIRIAMST